MPAPTETSFARPDRLFDAHAHLVADDQAAYPRDPIAPPAGLVPRASPAG